MISSTRTFSDPENNKLGQLSEELVELLGGVRRADNPNEPVIKDHPKVVYTNNAICTWEVFIWLFNPLGVFFWRRFQDFGSLRVWVIGPLLVKAKRWSSFDPASFCLNWRRRAAINTQECSVTFTLNFDSFISSRKHEMKVARKTDFFYQNSWNNNFRRTRSPEANMSGTAY